MAEAKRVTILNDRAGKIVLPADPEVLKKNPKAPHRELKSGETIEVSAEEAVKYLRYQGLKDLSKMVKGEDSPEMKALKAKLASSEAENARLKKGGKPDAGDDEGSDSETDDIDTGVLDAKKGVACLLPDGTSTGVIQSVNAKKKTAKVKLDSNGNVSEFKVSDLKPVPAGAAA